MFHPICFPYLTIFVLWFAHLQFHVRCTSFNYATLYKYMYIYNYIYIIYIYIYHWYIVIPMVSHLFPASSPALHTPCSRSPTSKPTWPSVSPAARIPPPWRRGCCAWFGLCPRRRLGRLGVSAQVSLVDFHRDVFQD